MRVPTAERPKTFFRGILRTSQGSVILVAVENMPIAPTGALTVATNCPYSQPAEPQERGAGVGQSIYIGQQYDAATQLSYLNARYYNGTQGQFLSQDPVFLGGPLTQNIADPQSLNAYGYSDDNPIVKSDPLGNFAIGIGTGGGGNVPGVYGDASNFWVLTVGTNPFEVELSTLTSGEGGGTTAVLGASASLRLITSFNAQNIQDLEGREAGGGGSAKALGDVGFDFDVGKADNSDNANNINPNKKENRRRLFPRRMIGA